MSDATTDQVVTPNEVVQNNNDNGNDQVSLADLKLEVESLQEFSEKNREENAAYRKKNRVLRQQLEALQAEQEKMSSKTLEDQGQYKELWEKERAEKLEYKTKFDQKVMGEKVSSVAKSFSTIATEHGCAEPDVAFTYANNKYQDMIDFDADTLQADHNSLVAVVEKMKIEHPGMFMGSRLNVKDSNPSKVKSGPKPLEDMTNSELAKLLAEQIGHS